MALEFNKTSYLKIYTGEDVLFEDIPLYKAILREARSLGLAGGTVIKGIEGYANVASENELVVAKCRATGFDILSCKMLGRSNPRKVKVAASDLIPHSSGAFYLKNKDLQHYCRAAGRQL